MRVAGGCGAYDLTRAGEFVWTDLSSPDPARAIPFYESVLGWSFARGGAPAYAMRGDAAIAGIYETPAKFQAMGMPSFWMSYIAVADVAETVAQASALGGIIELVEDDYALIRDPLGAGFTVHRSPSDIETPLSDAPGGRSGHSLLCSDLAAVTPFYAALFGWRFVDGQSGAKDAWLGETRVATAMALPDEVRGKAQYWAVLFASDNLAGAETRALTAGGASDGGFDLPEGRSLALRDPNGAAFFVVERIWRRDGS